MEAKESTMRNKHQHHSRDAVLTEATRFYLASRDFNGIPAGSLASNLGANWKDLTESVAELVADDLVGVLYGDAEMNTHILRVGFLPKEDQIAKLNTNDFYHTCLYPRPKHLESVVDRSLYVGKPYNLALALGKPQLSIQAFDLSILEFYRNDPRYVYSTNDLDGMISVKDEHYDSEVMPDKDKQVVQTFGFAYDADMNRAVAVFLRYLADLGTEHQQVWKAKEVAGDYRIHPDYYRSSILGEFGERLPLFSAFLRELFVINQMSEAMGRPRLFRKDFGEYGEGAPKKFGFLVRPTLEEFNNFILLLDKLLSDNMDKSFFQGEVSDESETQRKDGKIQVQAKGTLQMLDEWITKTVHLPDPEPWQKSIGAFRKVRKLRQKPAHALDENDFDQKYFKEQRELVMDAYGAVRTIRLLLANHPKVEAAGIEISKYLREGKIWTY